MPVVVLKMTNGRSNQQKKELIRRITDTVAEVAVCPKNIINVIIEDSCTLDDWGVDGKTWTQIIQESSQSANSGENGENGN